MDINKNSGWKILQLNISLLCKAVLGLNAKLSAQLCVTINYKQQALMALFNVNCVLRSDCGVIIEKYIKK